eukprot:TRINITY_DN21308_c0_g2_i1.p1 TRINITY_DN21308_c0_g2~~TRINITY_DN21308_c0_g2_i1.p1  ORF type:complete len:497 (-),score=68.09 TRINITY_DN21308_c0_g2_i1:13-1503(-)
MNRVLPSSRGGVINSDIVRSRAVRYSCGENQSRVCLNLRTVLLLLLPSVQATSFVVRNGLEYHAEHAVIHTTALQHRLRASKNARKHDTKQMQRHRMSVEVDARGSGGSRGYQLTTPLEDMSSEYTGLIGVGTNLDGSAQFEARVVFDTGSTNLWVASVLCNLPPCDHAGAQQFYDPAKSTTSEAYFSSTGLKSDTDIDIIFGTGELKGPLHVDTYRVGPMAVEKQPFAMIREMTGEVFSSFVFEGILGLAFPSLSFGGIDPFFERVIKAKLLKNNEFSFYLNTDTKRPSALLWGGVDKDLFEGPIVMFPVVQPHYWALELVDFKIGGKSVVDKLPDTGKARYLIVDSGTTYFTAPTSMSSHIMDSFPVAPCSQVNSYPPLEYVLRSIYNQTFTLEVGQETYMVTDPEDNCRPAFMQLDIKKKAYGPAMILGEVFMRHFFTVFSRGDGSLEQAKVGFAHAKLGAEPKTGATTASVKSSYLQSAQTASIIRSAKKKL